MNRRYSLEPFLALTGWTLHSIRSVAPCNGTEYRIRREEGVTAVTADVLAVAAGFHPYEVWPEMLEHAIAEMERTCPECSTSFLPTGRQRFCRDQCRKNHHTRAYRQTPEGAERHRVERRRYYAEHRDYELARQRRYDRRRRAA